MEARPSTASSDANCVWAFVCMCGGVYFVLKHCGGVQIYSHGPLCLHVWVGDEEWGGVVRRVLGGRWKLKVLQFGDGWTRD